MAILKSFYRPHTIAETVALLNQPNVHLVPLAGGAKLVGRLEASGLTAIDGVIDLRRLGLDYIRTDRDDLCIGATVTLTALANHELAGALVDGLLRRAAYGEGPLNLRNVATVGGIVATAEYDSELYAALLALDATATIHTAGAQGKSVETTIPLTHLDKIAGLLTEIRIPWQEGRGGHARVVRTPSDRPIVAALAVSCADGERVALCGVAAKPILAHVSLNPPDNFKGSAPYRLAMAAVVKRRALAEAANAPA